MATALWPSVHACFRALKSLGTADVPTIAASAHMQGYSVPTTRRCLHSLVRAGLARRIRATRAHTAGEWTLVDGAVLPAEVVPVKRRQIIEPLPERQIKRGAAPPEVGVLARPPSPAWFAAQAARD